MGYKMGVGCEDAGVRYENAHGEPDRCGREDEIAIKKLVSASKELSRHLEHSIAIAAFRGHLLKDDDPVRKLLDNVDDAIRLVDRHWPKRD